MASDRPSSEKRAGGSGRALGPLRAAESLRPVLSIRWLVSIGSVLLTSLVVTSVGVLAERNTRRELADELMRRLCVQADHVAMVSASAMLTPYPELTLHPFLLKLREREHEIALAVVCDRGGTILGDADPLRLGRRFRPPPGLKARAFPGRLPGVFVFDSPTLFVASALVAHPDGRTLGSAYIGMPRSYVESAVRRARRPVLALFASLILLGLLGSFLLTSTLLKPIGVLREGLERIGGGDLDVHLGIDSRTEFGRLAATVNRMTADLRRAQEQAIERERLTLEMQLAQRIQRSLLPAEGIATGSVVVSGRQRPAAEVGGDFYDIFALPDGRIGFAIADVAGKGLAGCLVASMMAALLVALRDGCAGPAALLSALDHSLSKRLDRGLFVTMFIAYLDPRTGTVVYASAGHHPALLLHRDGRREWLAAEGLPIATDRERGIAHSLKDVTVRLTPGDLLVQTTDGFHEAEGGPANEPFGFERVGETAASSATHGPRGILDALEHALDAWRGPEPAADDETVVVASFEGVSAPSTGGEPVSALNRLAEARARGTALKVPATVEALVRLEDWIARLPVFERGSEEERGRAAFVLHELCSNIVEHGYPDATGPPIQLWWLPRPVEDGAGAESPWDDFVILDQGAPFTADNQEEVDYAHPAVRRRGRGFGIDLVRRAGARIVYHPSTAVGNVTLVSFAPGLPGRSEEAA